MAIVEQYRQGAVNGFLHRPDDARCSMVLTHGAGLNCASALLASVATALCEAGILVLRCNLRFRDKRPTGPPHPAGAAEDRAGLREALNQVQAISNGPLLLGGHSYGGRQATILMTEAGAPPVSALLLLSYPFHPPRKPEQMRTAHFPDLRTPALFVHGTRDSFGSPDEVRTALTLLPDTTLSRVCLMDKCGHELLNGKPPVAERCASELNSFLSQVSVTL